MKRTRHDDSAAAAAVIMRIVRRAGRREHRRRRVTSPWRFGLRTKRGYHLLRLALPRAAIAPCRKTNKSQVISFRAANDGRVGRLRGCDNQMTKQTGASTRTKQAGQSFAGSSNKRMGPRKKRCFVLDAWGKHKSLANAQ